MEKFVTIVERTAAYFVGFLAFITFTAAILRYGTSPTVALVLAILGTAFFALVTYILGYTKRGVIGLIVFFAILLLSQFFRLIDVRTIPDGFIVGQMMQGIAICWGIATATYADRHITVDVLYEARGPLYRRICDFVAQTLTLLFFMAFSYALTYKVYDMYLVGEISDDLRIPLWFGYTLAAAGIIVAVIMAAIRWYQVVILRERVHSHV